MLCTKLLLNRDKAYGIDYPTVLSYCLVLSRNCNTLLQYS
nr:MAG TPA: hypothetical protein [Caudoviricetes sp.]